MIEIKGSDIMRGGARIGYVRGNDIYSREGKKLGYVSDNRIFNSGGSKVGWIEGDYVKTSDNKNMRIEENNKHVSGGEIPDTQRAAIRFFLGD